MFVEFADEEAKCTLEEVYNSMKDMTTIFECRATGQKWG